MELRKYWYFAIKWLWIIILGAAVAAGASYIVNRSVDPVYRASTTLLIAVQQLSNSSTPDYNSLLLSERLTRTYSQLIKMRPLMESTIDKMELKVTPDDLTAMIRVDVVRDTNLIVISVENASSILARDIANAVAGEFIILNREEGLDRAAGILELFRTQLTDLEQDISETMAALDILKAEEQLQSAEGIRLQAVLSQQQLIFSQLARSEQELRLIGSGAPDPIRVVEPAVRPSVPVRPKVFQDALLAGFVGLLLGIGISVLIEYLDDTVKTPKDVTQTTGLTTLGTIMRVDGSEGLVANMDVQKRDGYGSRSSVAEAYRILRMNIDFATVDKKAKLLLVTSPYPGEGKTTTLANLAIVMAQSGRRVIAVDSDLRRPRLHQVFGAVNTVGLTSLLLADEPELAPFLVETKVPNLSIIASGPIPPNPSELLGSKHASRLFERLREAADVVLLDSPPTLVVSDPTVIADRVDGVLLVAESGATRRDSLVRAKETLSLSSGKLLGVVLNKLTGGSSGYYYDYNNYGSEYYSDRSSDRSHQPSDNGRGAGHADPASDTRANWLGKVRRAVKRG